MERPKIYEEARKTASLCRHYAMCKIDFLGTGLCPSGPERHFVAYYPQGRMDIYDALARELIPVTVGLLDIADTCTLCGICDRQCHFYTGMRPLPVMRALKDYVAAWRAESGRAVTIPEDEVLKELRDIVGCAWATNDPAILVTYANDPFPLAGMRMPRYAVLPGSRKDVESLIKLADARGLPFAVRGNGGSVFGFVFTEGVVLDMNRMRGMEIDVDNWSADVEPGVTSFDLQREAYGHGLRVNAAEPAATVCGNIVCTGTFSTWSNAYGTAADNFVDMEFVDRSGQAFHLSDKSIVNHFGFQRAVLPSPGVCTRAMVKLHPVTDDEEGVLVPFADFDGAARFARNLSQRRIGLAVAVLGAHYIANFMSPTKELAARLKQSLPDVLGCNYMVFAIGDRYALGAIRAMSGAVIDSSLLRMLMLGLPRLLDQKWVDLIREYEGPARPYELLCKPEMRALLEAVLEPSPQTIAGAVEEDLRSFYIQLYERPEMTDMIWLNMFRIVSSRMSRDKHMLAFLVYVPLDRIDVIRGINEEFKRIADTERLDNDYGFLTPMDFGKRAILEYDYYIDHTDADDAEKIGRVMVKIEPWLDELAATTKGVQWLKYVFSQGCSRKENFLYESLRPERTAR